MQSIDAILHVNPDLEEKGLAMIFNPTSQSIRDSLEIPLYYTGLTDKVKVLRENGTETVHQLDRMFNVEIDIGETCRNFDFMNTFYFLNYFFQNWDQSH